MTWINVSILLAFLLNVGLSSICSVQFILCIRFLGLLWPKVLPPSFFSWFHQCNGPFASLRVSLEEDLLCLLSCAWFTNTIDCRWCSGQSPSDLWRGLNTSLSRGRPPETWVILHVQPYTALSDMLIKWQQKSQRDMWINTFTCFQCSAESKNTAGGQITVLGDRFYSSLKHLKLRACFILLQYLNRWNLIGAEAKVVHACCGSPVRQSCPIHADLLFSLACCAF